MSLNIGDKNKIKNSIIAETVSGKAVPKNKKSFYEKHPIICSFLISLATGIILLFSFWAQIISWIERCF